VVGKLMEGESIFKKLLKWLGKLMEGEHILRKYSKRLRRTQ
jgi:hypothetical protein